MDGFTVEWTGGRQAGAGKAIHEGRQLGEKG